MGQGTPAFIEDISEPDIYIMWTDAKTGFNYPVIRGDVELEDILMFMHEKNPNYAEMFESSVLMYISRIRRLFDEGGIVTSSGEVFPLDDRFPLQGTMSVDGGFVTVTPKHSVDPAFASDPSTTFYGWSSEQLLHWGALYVDTFQGMEFPGHDYPLWGYSSIGLQQTCVAYAIGIENSVERPPNLLQTTQ